ncbi:MAG: repeat-containing protein, partial [Verrucomicrobiales bacterium]|nr:repeat-containing protein [Verrucomicrobiales bacterium]
ANDSDVDGDTLTAVIVGNPSHGTVTLNANGSFSYTPTANYNGPDSFTYQAKDSALNSATATVNITVTPVNDAPVAANDSYSTAEDTTLNIAAVTGVLANDSDVDGDTLTAVIVGNPSHGTVTLNADGSFSYTPAANYNGSDSFTYQAKDSALNSATATVNITITAVNDAPVAANDSYSTAEDTTLNVPAVTGVLANDSDVDGNTLTATVVANPTHGTVTLNSDGSFTYAPTANYNGSDSFTYKASDGSLNSSTATVTITVNAINDPPVAVNDTYTIVEDSTLNGNVLTNDTDVDGDSLTATLVAAPTHGSLTFTAATGAFTYTPFANYNGTDSFTYTANDGQASSSSATVTITVTPANDAPVANNDSYSVMSGAVLTVSAPGLLANDTDVDGNALQVTSIVVGPTHGTLSPLSDGSFTYTPTGNYVGPDSFTYTANDGTVDSAPATVSITINANPVPTFGILAGPITLNGQTGLFEQRVTVTNTGSVTAPAFRVTVSGLSTNVTVYNATAKSNGIPYVHYNAPLDPNKTVTLILEFFNPKRTAFTDTLAALNDTITTTGTNAATGIHINKIYPDTTGRIFIEFPSIVGRTYMVTYSDDLNTWKIATPSITAGSTLTQWYDDGLPKTDTMPANRSYRALLVPSTP